MSNEAHIISHFGDLFVCTGEVPSTVRATGPTRTDATLLLFSEFKLASVAAA